MQVHYLGFAFDLLHFKSTPAPEYFLSLTHSLTQPQVCDFTLVTSTVHHHVSSAYNKLTRRFDNQSGHICRRFPTPHAEVSVGPTSQQIGPSDTWTCPLMAPIGFTVI
jgi:hypothetical protein